MYVKINIKCYNHQIGFALRLLIKKEKTKTKQIKTTKTKQKKTNNKKKTYKNKRPSPTKRQTPKTK